MRTWSGTTRAGHVGAGDNQRDVHRRLVDEETVLLFAVFSQRLPVVADGDDDRVVEAPARLEILDQPADLRVSRSHLAVVRSLEGGGEARPVRLGRNVRTVRIVEMHPCEKRTIAILAEPCQRVVDDLAAWSLRRVQTCGHLVV